MPKKELALNEAPYAFQEHIFFQLYRLEKLCKHEIKIIQLCEEENDVHNIEIYGGTHLTDTNQSTAFCVVKSLCLQVMNKGYTMYMY
jgi:hypothetical protein